MRRMLEDPDPRAIPGDLRRPAGRPVMRPNRSSGTSSAISGGSSSASWAFQSGSDSCSRMAAAQRAVPYRGASPSLGVPEHVIPVRMRREAGHDGLARLAKVVREAGHLGARDPGVDEQHAGPALHDDGVVLEELALVDQHALRDLPQHGWLVTLGRSRPARRAARPAARATRPSRPSPGTDRRRALPSRDRDRA